MTTALIFIASCLVGVAIIELHARYVMRSDMDRRVARLMLGNRSAGR